MTPGPGSDSAAAYTLRAAGHTQRQPRWALPITVKIGLVLLLPVAGALFGLGLFYNYLQETASDTTVINIAGRQRMVSQQMLVITNMIGRGQQSQGVLHSATTLFGDALRALAQGGADAAGKIPPPPAEVQDELARLTQLWQDQHPLLQQVIELPWNHPRTQSAVQQLGSGLNELTRAADSLVAAYRDRGKSLRRHVLQQLGVIALLDLVLLVAGVQITRRYVQERQHTEAALRIVADELALHSGDRFFQELTRKLTEVLQIECALIARLSPGTGADLNAQTIAVCLEGSIADNFEFSLAANPCENAAITQLFCGSEGEHRSPASSQGYFLLRPERCLSTPLRDCHGQTIGLLLVQGHQYLGDLEFARTILPVFARSAASELERMGAETALRESSEKQNFLAQHDPLTGLPNRTLLLDRLKQALARVRWRQRLVVTVLINLDRFKIVNDTLGHQVGDNLLQAVAARLRTSLRDGDTVARMGGDEFAIILADVADRQDVPAVVDKIRAALEQPHAIDGHELFALPSIGISLHPGDGDDAPQLVRCANIALHHAKEHGHNSYQFYSPEMDTSSPQRLALEAELRHALTRNEFVLYYQPQLDMKTGRYIGVEALIRWQHPTRGLVPPLDFIPLLEETGLMVAVGEWVLRTACAQARAWIDAGQPPLRVAVNISARQLHGADLAAMVARGLEESRLDPRYLELELTESALFEHTADNLAPLEKLSSMGVRIAVDDFGTGYSSLTYLKRFPIDCLKIDRSFVRDIITDPNDAAISQAVIAMGHSLGMTIVAEGIETDTQLALLREYGCDSAQGYLFSPPVPADKLTAALVQQASKPGKASTARKKASGPFGKRSGISQGKRK